MHPLLEVSEDQGVQTWTMRHAPVNAIGPDLLEALEDALQAVAGRPDVAAVVLTSAFGTFSAGADAKWMAREYRGREPADFLRVFGAAMDRFWAVGRTIRTSETLFIAAIGGHVVAGGLELAAACDLRFAADDDRIRIGVPEMRIFGEPPSGGGGTQYLARIMGASAALHLILDGEPCTPRRAHELGLVDRLCAPADVVGESVRWASELATGAGRIGIGAAKRTIYDGVALPLGQALDLDHEIHRHVMEHGRFLDGVRAFVERFG